MSTAVPPPLEVLDALAPPSFLEPRKRIVNEDDMERFKWTQGYNDIVQFVYQLNRALCPRQPPRQAGEEATPKTACSCDPKPAVSEPSPSSSSMPPPNLLGFPRKPKDAELPKPETFTIHSKRDDPPSVKQFQSLLERLKSLIDEAPPSKEPRRFGNASFRVWHRLLEERADGLLREFLPGEVLNYGYVGDVSPMVELRAYFLGSFGSSTRLDYGTGHELSFLAFLGCLWKLGGFKDGAAGRGGDIERSIVFGVFEPYLNLIRQLILTYTLEPAGTHGVWGLDDHFFLSYIFGSAQLTRPVASDDEPMPQEGSVRGAPKPADVCKAEKVELYRAENMYFAAIGFINDVKKGPFWEHSPVLYNVSGIKDGWGKINKGMIKMFVAEVLGKFPVVQHFPFGSLFAWDLDPAAPEWARKEAATTTTKVARRTDASLPAAGTQAPWAVVAPQGGGGPVPRPGGATQMPGSLPRPLARPGPSGGANSIPNVERRGGNA